MLFVQAAFSTHNGLSGSKGRQLHPPQKPSLVHGFQLFEHFHIQFILAPHSQTHSVVHSWQTHTSGLQKYEDLAETTLFIERKKSNKKKHKEKTYVVTCFAWVKIFLTFDKEKYSKKVRL